MTLVKKIQEDIKSAMKARNSEVVGTLRMLKSVISNRQIELKAELADEDVVRLVQTAIKQRKEAMVQYQAAGRQELADQEAAEAVVLEAYLPQQLSAEQLGAVVARVIGELSASGMKDMGRVMKGVLAEVGGQADGSVVSALVKEKLA